MSTFKEIAGRNIRSYTTNPDNPLEGQMWYNQTDFALKGVVASAAWSSAAPTINARSGASHGGTQTAAIISGGADLTSTEEYNGSGWSAGGALNTGRSNAGGAGIQTATLVFGGTIGSPNTYQSVNESYDGTSWTEEANISTARYNLGNGCGTQTSALYSGGYNNSNLDITEEWNGTAWTAGGAYTTITRDFPLVGTQDAALGFGGFTPSAPGSTTPGLANSYDGSTWTSITAMNTGRASLTGGGVQTYAIGAAGYNAPTTSATANTEIWDGTSWTESADLATPRFNLAGSKSGTASAFLGCTGYTPGSQTSLTEEYNFGTNIITPGAWASGGALATARQGGGGFGTQTSAAVVGGQTPALTNATEEYDGSSWTAGGTYPTAFLGITALGTQTAGVGFGGYVPSPGYTNQTNEYNGSSWTTVNNYPQTSNSSGACGTLTAGLGFGGDNTGASPRNTTTTAEYDGTNWTAGGALGTGGYLLKGAGTQTAAAAVGGQSRGSLTEEYNGSSWTAGGAPLFSVSGNGTTQAETQDAFIYISTSPSAATQRYDGTAFSTSPSLATGRTSGSGIGTATAGLYAGGREPAFSTATEEFTGETVSANIKTFTTS